jgi:hypothetical protein
VKAFFKTIYGLFLVVAVLYSFYWWCYWLTQSGINTENLNVEATAQCAFWGVFDVIFTSQLDKHFGDNK